MKIPSVSIAVSSLAVAMIATSAFAATTPTSAIRAVAPGWKISQPASAPMMLKAQPVNGTSEGQTGTVDPSGTEWMITDVPTAFAKAAEVMKKLSDETAHLAALSKTRELTAEEWKNYRWLKAEAQNYLRLLERLEPVSAKPKNTIPGEGLTAPDGIGDKPMGGSSVTKNCPPKPVQNSGGFWTKLMGPKQSADCITR